MNKQINHKLDETFLIKHIVLLVNIDFIHKSLKFMISMIIIGDNKRLIYMKIDTPNSRYFFFFEQHLEIIILNFGNG